MQKAESGLLPVELTLIEHDSDALGMSPLHMGNAHDRVMRHNQREGVRDADLAFDLEAGPLVGKIADEAIEAGRLPDAIVPAFKTLRRGAILRSSIGRTTDQGRKPPVGPASGYVRNLKNPASVRSEPT